MPLVRLEARNGFALGAPELYRETSRVDPKEILEGVAVAGLVGILRQLGDLAEFAAEVFHELQEQVMITSCRSHKLTAHVQRLEAALPPLERAFLAQRSHLHFAYTAGTNWRAHIRLEQNHYVGSDVPQFIMDSYEACRDPPSFHLLDRFDPGGTGSCLKRYSDPTFFKRSSVASGQASAEKILKDKKDQKIKKRRLFPRGEVSRGTSFPYDSGRMQFTQLNVDRNSSPSQTPSTEDVRPRSDFGEQRNLDKRNGSTEVEDEFNPSYSVKPEELDSQESVSYPLMSNDSDYLDYDFLEIIPSNEQGGLASASVTWDETTDTIDDSTVQDNVTSGLIREDDPNKDIGLPSSNSKPSSETDQVMDALNPVEVVSETGRDCSKKNEEEKCSDFLEKGADDEPNELINRDLDHQFSDSESNVLVDKSFANGSCQHDPVSPAYRNEINATTDLDSDAKTEESSQGSTRKVDFLENGDCDATTVMECGSHRAVSNFRNDDDSGVTPNDGAGNGSETLKRSPETCSSVTPVMLWTNGGLLGLQPSKPLDCGLVVNRPHDPSPDKNEKGSAGKNLSADLELELKNGGNSLHQNNGHSIFAGKMVSRVHQESSLGASRAKEKLLDGANEKTSPTEHQTARAFEQKNHQSVTYRTFSPSASPPLQRMKISFQPINGFETSKMKLKFRDGSCNNEGSRDVFPSFQLVPEASGARQNDMSDSDDDTFYRSSSSLIDGDCISYQSESNSEQWESGESPSEKDRDLYDAFHRISLSRSVLTISGNGREIQEDNNPLNLGVQFPRDENRLQSSKSSLTSDRQVFDTESLSIRKDLTLFKDVKEPECRMMYKDFKYDGCLEHSETAVSQLPKPAFLNGDKLIENKNLGLLKSSRNRESNQRKGIDEHDFLDQIRTRSFNLRPTVPTKRTVLSGGNASVQVTAILAKANAVRQAGGSDDGEDNGNWSDP